MNPTGSRLACPELGATRRALEARAADTLGSSDERRLRAHLLDCPDCAAEGLSDDPTVLFFSLAASSDPEPLQSGRSRSLEHDGQTVASDVMAALEIERARQRLQPSRRPMLRAASLVFLAGVLLALLIAKGQIPFLNHSSTPRDLQALGVSPAGQPLRAGASAVSLEPEGGATVRRPLIEDLENPGARVYQFASDSPKEPNVVFVVDRNADL
jgi:hypothetical protein